MQFIGVGSTWQPRNLRIRFGLQLYNQAFLLAVQFAHILVNINIIIGAVFELRPLKCGWDFSYARNNSVSRACTGVIGKEAEEHLLKMERFELKVIFVGHFTEVPPTLAELSSVAEVGVGVVK